jgi:hypothetical protein
MVTVQVIPKSSIANIGDRQCKEPESSCCHERPTDSVGHFN